LHNVENISTEGSEQYDVVDISPFHHHFPVVSSIRRR
jgi:hypothetical protein